MSGLVTEGHMRGGRVVQEIKILLADADLSVRSIIKVSAIAEGLSCDECPDGISALKRMRHTHYDLVILDTVLPDLDGKIVCRYFRKSSEAPVIFIGRDAKEEERLSVFSAGGNDFLQKPFYPRELMARIKNLLKLSMRYQQPLKPLTAGGIEIDTHAHNASVLGRTLQLTPREYELLRFFCQNPHQAFSRDALLSLVWSHEFAGTDRTVDTHVKSLRNKIDPLQNYIQTIWGYGYKFEPVEKDVGAKEEKQQK